MMDFRSLSHWLARPMSAATLATLSPTERTARTSAQKRLSNAKRHPQTTFLSTDVQPPPTRSPHRDWLSLDDPNRDIIRV
jgi:hypothetical protein